MPPRDFARFSLTVGGCLVFVFGLTVMRRFVEPQWLGWLLTVLVIGALAAYVLTARHRDGR